MIGVIITSGNHRPRHTHAVECEAIAVGVGLVGQARLTLCHVPAGELASRPDLDVGDVTCKDCWVVIERRQLRLDTATAS